MPPEETEQTSAFAPGGKHRHRKTKQGGSAGLRRAVVLAMAVPVASAALAGPSAFAADGDGTNAAGAPRAGSPDRLDADDAQTVANLNAGYWTSGWALR